MMTVLARRQGVTMKKVLEKKRARKSRVKPVKVKEKTPSNRVKD